MRSNPCVVPQHDTGPADRTGVALRFGLRFDAEADFVAALLLFRYEFGDGERRHGGEHLALEVRYGLTINLFLLLFLIFIYSSIQILRLSIRSAG